MKIKNLEVYSVQLQRDTWVWVSIETDTGLVGWGEVSDSSSDTLVAQLMSEYGSSLVGHDPRQIVALTEKFQKKSMMGLNGGKVASAAWSGIDQALWDLTAQSFEVPLYALLGGSGRTEIELYANLNRGIRKGDRSPQGLAERGKQALAEGFRFVKCTPFDEAMPMKSSVSIENGLKRFEALVDEVSIGNVAVDCHERFRPETLDQFMNCVQNKGIPYWIEDLVGREYQASFNAMRNNYPGFRLAAGEQSTCLNDLWHLISEQTVDVIMPDVKYVGGVSVVKYLIPLAEERGIWVSMHNHTGPIGTAFSAHLMSTCRYPIPLEFAFDATPERSTITATEEPIKNGVYYLSDTPGIGIKPDEEMLKRYATKWTNGHW